MPVPTAITDISTSAASNSPAGSDTIGNNLDNHLRGIQAVFRAETLNKSWERWGDTPTRTGNTTFTVVGDLTSRYTVGRRVKCTDSSTLYGVITASAYTSLTTVTVTLDSGNLSASLTEVQLGPDTNAHTTSYSDSLFRVTDNSDATKKIAFEASGITTATTRTLTVQDVSGTVYVSGGTDIPVADGGTGVSSLTAYAPVFGGTTSTGAVQSGTVGTSGQVLTSNGAGALPTFKAEPFSQSLFHAVHDETGTTDGGGATSGSFAKRTLDTVKTNEIASASLSTSVISLPAGTYYAEFSGAFYRGDACQNRLRDTTNNVTLITGERRYAANTATMDDAWSYGSGRFTLAGTANVELQYRTQTTQATNGLGIANSQNFGEDNIYGWVKIWKVA